MLNHHLILIINFNFNFFFILNLIRLNNVLCIKRGKKTKQNNEKEKHFDLVLGDKLIYDF